MRVANTFAKPGRSAIAEIQRLQAMEFDREEQSKLLIESCRNQLDLIDMSFKPELTKIGGSFYSRQNSAGCYSITA